MGENHKLFAYIIYGGFMILRINNLIKEYGKNNTYQKVLDNISFKRCFVFIISSATIFISLA